MQQSKCCALPLGDSPMYDTKMPLRPHAKGGYWDSNPGPPEPQSGALTNCAIATITYEFGTEVPNEPEGIRTPDPRLRRPLLYPAELRTHKAGDGNRTHVSSLEGWCSTIELHPHIDDHEASFPSSKFEVSVSIDLSPLIGVTGFEPATSWSQTRRSSQAEPHPVDVHFMSPFP